MEKKINLEEIANSSSVYRSLMDEQQKHATLSLMKEFGKQLLELASENAKVFETEEDIERRNNCVDEDDNIIDEIYFFDPSFVDKQSILNTINQIE